MLESSRVPFLFRGTKEGGDCVKRWLRELLPRISSQDDPRPREEFKQLSKLILERNSMGIQTLRRSPNVGSRFSDEVLEDIARGLLQLDDVQSLLKSIRLHKSEIPSSLFPDIGKSFAILRFSGLHET